MSIAQPLRPVLGRGRTGHPLAVTAAGAQVGRPHDDPRQKSVFIDYSDLVSFFRRGLPITGIQRVIYELGVALSRHETDYRLIPVSLTPFRRRLVPISSPMLTLIDEYGSTNDFSNRSMIGKTIEKASFIRLFNNKFSPRLHKDLNLSQSWLLMLGASWARDNYDSILTALKDANIECKKAVLVHDLLPIARPRLASAASGQAFRDWINLVLATADVIFTPSRFTAQTLMRYQGYDCGRIVPINFGVARINTVSRPVSRLAGRRFILYVSTIDPRKNHRVAIKAWVRAFTGRPAEAPDFVCVGHSKRRSRDLLIKLTAQTGLASKLHFLEDVDDLQLRYLYENCLFFVFPSKFEGWGLPVAEAMSFGKFGIVSRTTSLPEVGGPFVDYAHPYAMSDWVDGIATYATQPDRLAERERQIAAYYRPPSWEDTAAQILDALERYGE